MPDAYGDDGAATIVAAISSSDRTGPLSAAGVATAVAAAGVAIAVAAKGVSALAGAAPAGWGVVVADEPPHAAKNMPSIRATIEHLIFSERAIRSSLR
jgi:hypothetical protein